MTIDETKAIIRKIKTFRPFFQTGNGPREEAEFLREWHKVLEPYEHSDVDRKLVEYFRDGDNIGKIPDVYYITKYLKTHSEKQSSSGIWVRCPLCQKELAQNSFDSHYDRCSSVNYIYKKTEQYFNQTLDKRRLFEMPQDEFDKRYLDFLNKLLPKVSDLEEKTRLEKIVKLLNGENIHITVQEMM